MFKSKIIAATLAVSALALVAACAQGGGAAGGATGQEHPTEVDKGMGSPDLERNPKDKLVAPTSPSRSSQDSLIREGQTGNK